MFDENKNIHISKTFNKKGIAIETPSGDYYTDVNNLILLINDRIPYIKANLRIRDRD